jgi:hypothetical protein
VDNLSVNRRCDVHHVDNPSGQMSELSYMYCGVYHKEIGQIDLTFEVMCASIIL